MTYRSPSYRWTHEHGRKKLHRFWIQAWWHAWSIRNHRTYFPGQKRVPYPCLWGVSKDAGETARRHWHVGTPKA